MASIGFKNYNFRNFSYRVNENLDIENIDRFEVESDFSAKIAFEDNQAYIIMDCQIGNNDMSCPFIINVELTGVFDIEFEKDDAQDIKQLKELLSQNAIAILYPYIRSLVSDITSKANSFDTFIMPVANIAKVMKENNKIEILELER
ncbi:TPA: protein-export chaperone SecB [Staphylococcus pseudintermedius]|uniref:protein-export chaperone SecB n=1 Tax=Staphylococcus pseudintermedius TaxID=283734 RepID=UPI000BBCEDEB|nr:protein-export chaperone SecB [Staphylococcus pseudintermedius]MBU7228827.1 protein-export chaperone SecB [Staphylococcus pseudintermedius]MCE5763060.1 protein-export chaperone SecB [Staphylococcus pseudintermedius]MCE5789654.1 protein-export chaperone SecB [Staphylococcus pseudintermedius]MDU0286315.1 protein-export chaperone SecB [Staphylococcus pseudintermedius]PCF64450.1 preprotein translocase subunit SecB [Staphylococcus pseudintermedius]